jgi:hypothetical protein
MIKLFNISKHFINCFIFIILLLSFCGCSLDEKVNRAELADKPSRLSSEVIEVSVVDKNYANFSRCINCHTGNFGANYKSVSSIEFLCGLKNIKPVYDGGDFVRYIVPQKPCESLMYLNLKSSKQKCDNSSPRHGSMSTGYGSHGWMGKLGDSSVKSFDEDLLFDFILNYSNHCDNENLNVGLIEDVRLPGEQHSVNKFSVYSVLFKIFSAANDENLELKKILKRNIHDNPFYFGGSCDPYDLKIIGEYESLGYQPNSTVNGGARTNLDTRSCLNFSGEECGSHDPSYDESIHSNLIQGDYTCKSSSHMHVPLNQVTTTLRAGLMQKTCGKIIFPELNRDNVSLAEVNLVSNKSVDSALMRACGEGSCSGFDKDSIKSIIQLFYPMLKKISGSKIESLIPDNLVLDLKSDIDGLENLNTQKKIRLLLYILCIDPTWQS